MEMRSESPNIGYSLRGNRYLNITNRCTLRCAFCPKFNDSWQVHDKTVLTGYDLRLRGTEPTADEILAAIGDPDDYDEVVFCGLGEPTLRLYTLLDVASRLRGKAARVRLNTDGLANLVYGRDVTPDFEGILQALSVSLNAQDEETYNRHCRPLLPDAYSGMLDFVRRAREFVPEITLTAIDGLPGVDIDACRKIADDLGVHFRRRVLDVVG
ncbi:MAG: radical SAM protein [Gammaproteobacteria bacterium]|nr:radical SAM protein [Gammaproteobacteria bacterium]